MQTVEVEWLNFKEKYKSDPLLQAALQKQPDHEEANPYSRLLCSIVLMRRLLLDLFNVNGAVFFRSSKGEELFDVCVSQFLRICPEFIDEQTLEWAALGLPPDKTPDCKSAPEKCTPQLTLTLAIRTLFHNRGSSSTPVSLLSGVEWKAYHDRITAKNGDCSVFDGYINLLRICAQLLSFESDRTFYQTEDGRDPFNGGKNEQTGWYFDAPKFEITPGMLELPTATLGPESKRLIKQEMYGILGEYLESMPDECRPSEYKEISAKLAAGLAPPQPITPTSP